MTGTSTVAMMGGTRSDADMLSGRVAAQAITQAPVQLYVTSGPQ